MARVLVSVLVADSLALRLHLAVWVTVWLAVPETDTEFVPVNDDDGVRVGLPERGEADTDPVATPVRV